MFIKINKLFIVCMEYVGRKLAKSLEIDKEFLVDKGLATGGSLEPTAVVAKERVYDDLGDCAKSLYNLVVDNPNRFIVYTSERVSSGQLESSQLSPIKRNNWNKDIPQRGIGGVITKIKDTLTDKTISLGYIERLYGFTGRYWRGYDDSYKWEKSGFSDLVSREDWILLVELLLQYNRKRHLRCHQAMVRIEQKKQKKYNKEMAKLYCVCDDKQ
jgi:hypothetical protein